MYPIIEARKLADKIFLMVVEAPRIAKNCQPGEFVIVKIDEVGRESRLLSVTMTGKRERSPSYSRP